MDFVECSPKTLKMVLDTSLLNTWQYKVRIKGKVEQSRERSSAIPYTSIEKGAFWLPSTTVTNFTYFFYQIFIPLQIWYPCLYTILKMWLNITISQYL